VPRALGLSRSIPPGKRETARASRIVTRRREDWDLTEKDTAATTSTTSITLAVVAAPDTVFIVAAAGRSRLPRLPRAAPTHHLGHSKGGNKVR
jgi:hypothetical protein